ARVWDLSGHTIYAGIFDSYGEMAIPWDQDRGAPYWNSEVRPQLSVAERYQPDTDLNKRLREQGITVRLVAPTDGILRGTSALVTTSDAAPGESLLRGSVAQHLRMTPTRGGGGRSSYPNSPMGAVA